MSSLEKQDNCMLYLQTDKEIEIENYIGQQKWNCLVRSRYPAFRLPPSLGLQDSNNLLVYLIR